LTKSPFNSLTTRDCCPHKKTWHHTSAHGEEGCCRGHAAAIAEAKDEVRPPSFSAPFNWRERGLLLVAHPNSLALWPHTGFPLSSFLVAWATFQLGELLFIKKELHSASNAPITSVDCPALTLSHSFQADGTLLVAKTVNWIGALANTIINHSAE